ncbi:MAG: hypothetical protein R3C53_10205 [Pirellulaceae bacterium]
MSQEPPALPIEGAPPTIDRANAQALFAKLLQQQNFPLAIVAGLIAAIAGGFAWAAITVATGFQIGWLAVGIGFLVGVAVRSAGKGLTKKFGIAGGLLALFGCALGNLLAMCAILAEQMGAPFVSTSLTILSDPVAAVELMKAGFSPIDVLFYGIAVYEGYKFSFREVSDADLQQMIQ